MGDEQSTPVDPNQTIAADKSTASGKGSKKGDEDSGSQQPKAQEGKKGPGTLDLKNGVFLGINSRDHPDSDIAEFF